MTPFVIWSARALTFFNVLVLLWLGLTVLLNAERRRLGTWLTGGGLLLGGACSIARASAQAAQPIEPLAPSTSGGARAGCRSPGPPTSGRSC